MKPVRHRSLRLSDAEKSAREQLARRLAKTLHDNPVLTRTAIAEQAGLDVRCVSAIAQGARRPRKAEFERLTEWLDAFDRAFPDGLPKPPPAPKVAFDAAALLGLAAVDPSPGEQGVTMLSSSAIRDVLGAALEQGLPTTPEAIAPRVGLDTDIVRRAIDGQPVDLSAANRLLEFAAG